MSRLEKKEHLCASSLLWALRFHNILSLLSRSNPQTNTVPHNFHLLASFPGTWVSHGHVCLGELSTLSRQRAPGPVGASGGADVEDNDSP